MYSLFQHNKKCKKLKYLDLDRKGIKIIEIKPRKDAKELKNQVN